MAFLVDRPMPTACDECPCMYDYIQCKALKDNVQESLSAVDDYTIRQTWCPLKEAVRCKDCQYGIVHKNEVECTAHQEQGYNPEPYHPLDWFCADGKAKEGEQK